MFNRRSFLSLAALSLYPLSADTYVLPGYGILREAKRKLKRSKGLKVVLDTQVWGHETRMMNTLSERWDFTEAGRLTTRWQTTETRWSAGMAAPISPTFPGLDLRVILLGLFGSVGLDSVLSHLSISPKKSRLGLLNSNPMLVVGTKTPRDTEPDIWFNKATWTVERIRFGAPESRSELRLSDWGQPATYGLFPQRMTLSLNDRPVRLSKTVRLETAKERVTGD